MKIPKDIVRKLVVLLRKFEDTKRYSKEVSCTFMKSLKIPKGYSKEVSCTFMKSLKISKGIVRKSVVLLRKV